MIARTRVRLTTAVALAASLAGLGVGAASTASADDELSVLGLRGRKHPGPRREQRGA